MVDHPVVEDDDSRLPAQRVDDPAVRVGIVSDVVDGDVRVRHGTRAPGSHRLDVDEARTFGRAGAEAARTVTWDACIDRLLAAVA